jgi:hypothetical protein
VASCTRRLWKKVGGDEQRFGTFARHRGESRIDLAAVARVEDLDFQPENVCRFLHLSPSGLGAHNVARVDHHGDANHSRHQIAQQPQSLWHRLADEEVDAGRVPTWPREVGDQTKLDRIMQRQELAPA